MAPAVQVMPEHGAEAERPVAVETRGGGSGPSATTTTKEAEIVVVTVPKQEQQHDAVPRPDLREDAAAGERAVEASASASNERTEKEKPPAAMERGVHDKAPDEDGDGRQESTRERLKRHRMEVAGSVWVPEQWGQEKLLRDWVDCAVFDRPLAPAGLLKARRALVAETCTRRPDRTSTGSSSSAGSSPPFRVQNGCS